jgi:acyl carrier protein
MRPEVEMTMLREIEQKLTEFVASITNTDAVTIGPDMPFQELGIDSLGFVEILVFIEKTFKLQLIASDLTRKDFETIHTLASFISRSR